MKSVSITYSQALFSLCEEENKETAVLSQLLSIREIIRENGEYHLVLDSPMIPLEERLSLVQSAFSCADEYVTNFISLLCEKKCFHLFTDCVAQYEKLYNKKHGIEAVTAITAVPLSDALKERLIKKLEREWGKKISLSLKVDKSLIGGIVLRTENSQTDASVRARLDAIMDTIASAQM